MKIRQRFLTFALSTGLFLSACNGPTSVDREYNVYFFTANVNASQVDTILNQKPGTLIKKPNDPTRSGFEFVGWYDDVGLTNAWDFTVDLMPEASMVLYASWEASTRTITYELNGGTMKTEDYQVEYSPGDNVILPQAERVGFTFKGWFYENQNFVLYPNSEGTKPGEKSVITISSSSFENIVIYAHWAVIQSVVSFKVNHPIPASVQKPGTIRVSYGTIIQYGTNFPRDFGIVAGYLFVGWNSKADGTGEWFRNDTVFNKTSSIELFGQWQPVPVE